MSKKFSIIVPVYNASLYLKECIDSVINQKYENYELILVDNASTDDSLEICNSYKESDSRISVLQIYENNGVSKARNLGLKNASGDYVLFLDSDDFYIDNSFLNKVNSLLEKKDEDIVLFKSKQFFDDTHQYGSIRQGFDYENVSKLKYEKSILYLVKNGYFEASPWNKIYNRNLIKDMFFIDGIRGEDVEWFNRVIHSSKSIGFIDGVYHAYRVRSSSTSKTGWNLKCWNDIYEFLFSSYELIDFTNLFDCALYDIYTKFWYILLGFTNKFDDRKIMIKKLKSIKRYRKIHLSSRNRICNLLVFIFGYKIGSKLIYKYIGR